MVGLVGLVELVGLVGLVEQSRCGCGSLSVLPARLQGLSDFAFCPQSTGLEASSALRRGRALG